MIFRTRLRRLAAACGVLAALAAAVSTWTWIERCRRVPIGRAIVACRTVWACPADVPRVPATRIGAETEDQGWISVDAGVHGIWDFSHGDQRLCLVEGHVAHPLEELIFAVSGLNVRSGGSLPIVYLDPTSRLQVRDGQVWREFRRIEPR